METRYCNRGYSIQCTSDQVITITDSIVQDDQSINDNEDGHTNINDKNISEDKICDELNSSPQLNGMKSNKIVNQGYKTLLPKGSSKSTNISVNYIGTTNTSTFLQG